MPETKSTEKKEEYKVPQRLMNLTVWTKPPDFKRNVKQPGRFALKSCNQKELAYLYKKGVGIEKSS